MNRRAFLTSSCAALIATPLSAASCQFEICRSDAEWRERLSENEYTVLREEETEQPFTSPLNDEKRAGTYQCRGCDLPVYDAAAKYDSETGWPSFFESLPNSTGTRQDRKLVFQIRTEVHCRRCGSHLGHVFDDGPEPTGKRHCLNGLSLAFVTV